MLKPKGKIFLIIQISLDLIFILLSVYLTFCLRVALNPYFTKKLPMSDISQFAPPIYLIALFYLFVQYYLGIYNFSKTETILDIFFQTAKGSTLVVCSIILLAFLFKAEHYSRSIILLLWGVSIILLNLSHVLGTLILKWSKRKGIGVEKIAFVGFNGDIAKLSERIQSLQGSIYHIVGYIESGAGREHDIGNKPQLCCLGRIENVVKIINEHMIDRIVISESLLSRPQIYELIQICSKMDIQLDCLPEVSAISDRKLQISEIEGILLFRYPRLGLSSWDRVFKRSLDIIVSALALLFLLPLISSISLLIKLDSKGPIFFKQKRVGKGGKSFIMYKFRSMVVEAEKIRHLLDAQNETGGYLFKIKNDPRITRIGKIIRKTSLDEVPSFLNILLGDMSLVGPRPLPYADMQKELQDPRYRVWAGKRAEVVPGITGLWQISGRSDLGFEDMVKMDLFYIENWTLLLDLKILFKSIPFILSGRGAY